MMSFSYSVMYNGPWKIPLYAYAVQYFFQLHTYILHTYDQCEDKFSRLFLLTLSVKAKRISNLIVCVLGWSTDWGADRWIQGGILPLRQGWRRHHHHQGVGNCKYFTDKLSILSFLVFQRNSMSLFVWPLWSITAVVSSSDSQELSLTSSQHFPVKSKLVLRE